MTSPLESFRHLNLELAVTSRYRCQDSKPRREGTQFSVALVRTSTQSQCKDKSMTSTLYRDGHHTNSLVALFSLQNGQHDIDTHLPPYVDKPENLKEECSIVALEMPRLRARLAALALTKVALRSSTDLRFSSVTI